MQWCSLAWTAAAPLHPVGSAGVGWVPLKETKARNRRGRMGGGAFRRTNGRRWWRHRAWNGRNGPNHVPNSATRAAWTGGAAGLVVGIAAGWYLSWTMERKDHLQKDAGDPSTSETHQALKHGVPSSQTLRFFDGFVSCFDKRTRNPDWVLEHLTKDKMDGPGDRNNASFQEDSNLARRFRSKLDDFKGSGYDRGHLAPAANHRFTHRGLRDTFTLSNVSPQVGKGFNRDYWARFEKFVKDLVWNSDEVFVVTGPLYLPSQSRNGGQWRMNYPLIGSVPQLIAVPTHFYKVVLTYGGKAGSNNYSVGAFVMPNAEIDPGTPLARFSVRLDDLESVSGVSFFPKLISEEIKENIDRISMGHQLSSRRMLPESAESLERSLEAFKPSQPPAVLVDPAVSSLAPFRRFDHLCSKHECKLPPTNFWEKRDKKKLPKPKKSTNTQ